MTRNPATRTSATSHHAAWARDPARPRVLIARMSAIGDTILTTPVACRLRERFPGAYLAWVVEQKSARFVEGHPAIDETIVLPRGWFVSPKSVLALRRRLSPMRFDATIDCQSITKSALACWATGAPLRIGCRGRYGSELSPWLNNRLVEPRRPHLTDRSLELLGPLGIEAAAEPYESVRWDLPRSPGAEQNVARWAPDDAFAVINPGATWDSKLWEMERFGEVAKRLGERRGLASVVVWGGDREQAWAKTIAASSGGWAKLAPPTSLPELAALLRQARLLLSSDTGPMHLAVAVGAPTVGLFGSTHPDDCGPYGAPHEAVLKRFQAGGRRARRKADNAAMRQISVDDAWGACLRVLDRTACQFPHAPAAMAS
ncbi:Lipopolysaccharide heptosyltransferase 1 [Botrimarina colliarenosi]|uniref:Lipopolysaccharide heptosyltransferase 1 n=1 Tax=Botrimarina colliarenosi TaxID=2528001 RepID=A0A5C6AFC1_9BACT|nr:glycosyltransferase family 9 protein [Botrimarina colliarenosi]TWT98117.1 Lipopolysaccharide heptosyltransferase 1 [Botrimarina colliarenosi]